MGCQMSVLFLISQPLRGITEPSLGFNATHLISMGGGRYPSGHLIFTTSLGLKVPCSRSKISLGSHWGFWHFSAPIRWEGVSWLVWLCRACQGWRRAFPSLVHQGKR